MFDIFDITMKLMFITTNGLTEIVSKNSVVYNVVNIVEFLPNILEV